MQLALAGRHSGDGWRGLATLPMRERSLPRPTASVALRVRSPSSASAREVTPAAAAAAAAAAVAAPPPPVSGCLVRNDPRSRAEGSLCVVFGCSVSRRTASSCAVSRSIRPSSARSVFACASATRPA